MQVRLLLDANLSWRSVAILRKYFDNCLHADDTGLPIPAKDIEIWDYALKHGLLIVTNDEDFLCLSFQKGFPPKVLLLRTGNQSRQYIEQTLIDMQVQINNFAESVEYGVLEII
jgi:predicted nuclease of predicted toxin-antitoxin system